MYILVFIPRVFGYTATVYSSVIMVIAIDVCYRCMQQEFACISMITKRVGSVIGLL